jgi:pimeloyl-ACP methyl ester carboxylesterase
VVSLAGCSVLELADAWGLDGAAAADLLGGAAGEVPERYALADPAALLPLAVPVTLLHGTEDQQVPLAMSQQYAARAERVGDSVKLIELAGLDHFALIDPLSVAWPNLVAAIDS